MDLKELAEKKGRFSLSEINYIIEEGAKVGVLPPKKKTCQNCWRDMAIEIIYYQRKNEDPLRPKSPKRFRDGSSAERYGVEFKGRTITSANIEENWDWMMENGFPQSLLHHED